MFRLFFSDSSLRKNFSKKRTFFFTLYLCADPGLKASQLVAVETAVVFGDKAFERGVILKSSLGLYITNKPRENMPNMKTASKCFLPVFHKVLAALQRYLIVASYTSERVKSKMALSNTQPETWRVHLHL